MGGRFLALCALCAVGCLQTSVPRCDDGSVCPPGKVCAAGAVRCVLPEQLAECSDAAEGDPCEYSGGAGACRDGACLAFDCGDGVAMGLEQCDHDDLGGVADCGVLGYYGGGPLACRDDCTFDTDGCLGGICGDHVVNGPEPCEPQETPPADCTDFDFYDPGPAPCNDECRFDVSDCTGSCGDGIINGGESCDEGIALLETCPTFGYHYGWIECRACVPFIDDCHRFGWHPVPVEATSVVRSIHGSSRTDVWAVGDFGLVLHSSGARFDLVAPAVSDDFTAVVALAPDEAYLAANGGTIQRWDGDSWTVSYSGAGWSFDTLWSAGPDHVLAGGNLGLLRWNGTAWAPVTGPAGGTAPTQIWGTAADDYYMIDASERLHHWSGGSWTTVFPNGVRAIGGRAADEVYMVATNGTSYSFDGQDWTQLIGFLAGARAIVASDEGVYWVGDNNLGWHFDGSFFWTMIASSNSGLGSLLTAWQAGPGELYAGGTAGLYGYEGSALVIGPYAAAPPAALTGIWAESRTNVFGAAGDVFRFAGANWTVSLSGKNIRAVWGTTGTDVFGVGDSGAIWHFDGTWSKQTTPPTTPHLLAVSGTSSNDVWAVGLGGSILHYNGSWSVSASPTAVDLLGVWAASPSDAVAVGAAGTILRWNGATWAVVPPVTNRNLRAVTGFASSDVIAVGDGGTVLRWNGTAWAAVPTGTSMKLNAVWGSAPDDVFVVGNLGTVLHDDGYGLAPVKVSTVGQSEVFSVGGTAQEIQFGTFSTNSTPIVLRTSPWKRRFPPM